MLKASLEGKTALITGASAGFGRATALLLAEAGARVLAVARRKDRLEDLARHHPRISPVVQDLRKLELPELRSALKDQPVDILVNNAGLALGRNPIHETSVDDWQTMIDTNLKPVIAVTQLVLTQMVERKSGDIVNIGSVAGYHAYPGGSIYCATKAAIVQLTDAWRLDLLGKGIRVIGIHPGMAETEFSAVRFGGDKEAAKKVYEGMTPLTSEDIAETILWTLTRPRHVNIQSMVIYPTDQAGVGAVHRRT